ncbi:metallophosphoesterase [Corynebacterium ulceribovis]|uniref:metallophosphoesterase n=1 Tax=Corynebacterium ulceribovis TaxID=487732 RepID=UPI0003745485|nr:metallophosphoesterase [Corynebacterium ulceribovis]
MDVTAFDIIGDVHGCLDELLELLARLGYDVTFGPCDSAADSASVPISAVAPPGRQAVFLGDLVDRGPDPVGVVRLVMGMCAAGSARMVIGNHDDKLRRFLHGNDVKLSGSFGVTAPLFAATPRRFQEQVRDWLDGLPYEILLVDDVAVVHASRPDFFSKLKPKKQRSLALFGVVDSSQVTETGYPVRLDWAQEYSGHPLVVHGHTPVAAPRHVNGVICVDTACCFGGELTAFRWPEWDVVSVPARQAYATTPVPRIVCQPGQSVPFAAEQVR